MPRLVYVFEESDDTPTHERDLFEIDSAGYCVDMSAVYVEHCDCMVSVALRDAFQAVSRRLQPGDTLVTTKLWAFGNSVAEVVATLNVLERRRISAICLACGHVDLCSEAGQSFVHGLKLADELERVTRRHRARSAASVARERGVAQGRPNSLSDEQQRQALKALGAGSSVTAIARNLHTSRQTIMRLRSAHGPLTTIEMEETPSVPTHASESVTS